MDELAQCVNMCIERWKNAGPEARKKMFSLFAVAGIFLVVCRHGHVLVLCDIIRSGELYILFNITKMKENSNVIFSMKYPLAMVDRLFKTYGEDICLGYDIMCAFIKTLSRSVLGPKTTAFRLHGVVPSFHSHAHNHSCQLHWHPMYTEGVGLEDFEECERTFGKFNDLAGVMRLASPYHHFQHIDEHFMFHDFDKHALSGMFSVVCSMNQKSDSYTFAGNFIYQNYRQALDKIFDNSRLLSMLESRLHTSADDYEQYLIAEREHLQSLKKEPEEVKQALDYLELLKDLYRLE